MEAIRVYRGKFFSGLLAACALAACCGCTGVQEYVSNGFKVGPNYQQPPAAVAEDWIDQANPAIRRTSEDLHQWWTVFNDPALNFLIETAYQQNLTLREAGSRILQARATRNIARGTLFPQQQNANGRSAHYAVSQLTANSSFRSLRFFDESEVGFNLNWELDFWGGFRRAVESANAGLDASVYAYDAAVVTLVADVASAYVTYRMLEEELRLVQKNIVTQTKTRDLAAIRVKLKVKDNLDLDQAQSNLLRTEALVPQFQAQMRIASNQLCILLGMPAQDLERYLQPGSIPTAPPTVGAGVPAELLSRRPDVLRAERAAAAQCAQIGVATAELYPHISITGALGWQAEQFDDLLKDKALNAQIGPSFRWNILNYGRLVNNIRLQDARFQELIAAYQNTVLQAGKEVEDGLIRFLMAQRRTLKLEGSVDASRKAEKLVITQFEAGTVDFNRVAVVQQSLVEQQDLLAQAQAEIAQSLIFVYRALGGGWQIGRDHCPGGQGPVAHVPAGTTRESTPTVDNWQALQRSAPAAPAAPAVPAAPAAAAWPHLGPATPPSPSVEPMELPPPTPPPSRIGNRNVPAARPSTLSVPPTGARLGAPRAAQ